LIPHDPGSSDPIDPSATSADPGTPTDPASPTDPNTPARPGAGTFTIEGRAAPGLFLVGWLATLIGIGAILIGLLAGGRGVALILVVVGLVALSIGLVAGAGVQGIERRARGAAAYTGPSPFLLFAASIPTLALALILVGVPLTFAGVPVDGPIGQLVSVTLQALVWVGLIRLLVVDGGALSWADMGLRRFDRRALTEFASGALWAGPVIIATIPVALILGEFFPVQPVSPLPATGDNVGFAIQLLAGAVVAPVAEELLFRGFATTAWARTYGARRGLIQAALCFALVHIINISGGSAGEAFGLVVVGFATRIPVALALGWLVLRERSIWAPIGLHATFNGVLLVLGELAFRNGIVPA
jgi:CAAX protease family protein